jgi:hypothetical protein
MAHPACGAGWLRHLVAVRLPARYGVYRVPITLLNTNAFSTYAEGHSRVYTLLSDSISGLLLEFGSKEGLKY